MGLKVGVTGGIGSGKTTVCRIFSLLGVPVFSADDTARKIMDSDIEIEKRINNVAGRNMYSASGLDRKGLAALIFNNRDLLEKINKIVHPVVREKFELWAGGLESEYVIYEAAILFESGASSMLDRIITVIAPVEERIARVIRRNNLSREQVLERIRNQSDDDFKISGSDYVIDNSENEMIIPAIITIHNDLRNSLNKR
jgi:dephospho-CoA kinase